MTSIDLAILQDIQGRFDLERGFSGLGRNPDQSHSWGANEFAASNDDALRTIEYSALALCGEVGELANAVKKARRALTLGFGSPRDLLPVEEELPDIFAYLLKLSGAIDCNLTELYLEKMSQNCVRFPRRPLIEDGACVLTIAGPSGVGKTTIARRLQDDFDTYLEIADGNPHLPKLLRHDPTFDAAGNQSWFLEQQEKFLAAASSTYSVVIDQDPTAIVRIYARRFRKQNQIEPGTYCQLLLRLMELESRIAVWPGGRKILFLDAPAEVLRDRILLRNYPVHPALDWFVELRENFIELATSIPNAIVISTADNSVDQVAEAAANLIHQSAPF